jgi:two-component system, chemotaxis family, protein-glutamate methylesterase/glutaminase
MAYEVVVVGASWGGLHAVRTILAGLPEGFQVPIVIVQHRSSTDHGNLAAAMGAHGRLPVVEVDDKTPLEPGHVYVAPSDYHTMLDGRMFSLSLDEHVHFSRPAIDVLFESAADFFGPRAIGLVLTGANRDGAEGLLRIKESGGYTIVQDPGSASQPVMPQAAIDTARPHKIASLEEIAGILAAKTRVARTGAPT